MCEHWDNAGLMFSYKHFCIFYVEQLLVNYRELSRIQRTNESKQHQNSISRVRFSGQCSAHLLMKKVLCQDVLFRMKPIDILVQTICQLQVNCCRKLFNCTHEKKKLRTVQYLNYGNYFSCSSWDQGQIGFKLGTNHVIYQKLASFTQKKDIYVNRLESVFLDMKMCILQTRT